MKTPLSALLLLGALSLSAASGQHIKRAVLSTKSGAPVASQEADSSGQVVFTGIKPGEYRLTLTNADGRSVSIGDLDGDGVLDVCVVDPSPPAVSDVKSPRDAASGQASGRRDAASGLPTGRRLHRPIACLVDWNGTVKGGFSSEMEAKSAGKRMSSSSSGACVVSVDCSTQPGKIKIQSSSWDLATNKKI